MYFKKLIFKLPFSFTSTPIQVASNGESTLDMAALNEKLESINRVVRQAQQVEGEKLETAASDSQRVESKAPAIDELSLDNEETDDNRNKR